MVDNAADDADRATEATMVLVGQALASFQKDVARIVGDGYRGLEATLTMSLQSRVLAALASGEGKSAFTPTTPKSKTVTRRVSSSGRRPVRDVIVEHLATSVGPVSRRSLEAAVMAEGWTADAFKKRWGVMLGEGLIEKREDGYVLSPVASPEPNAE